MINWLKTLGVGMTFVILIMASFAFYYVLFISVIIIISMMLAKVFIIGRKEYKSALKK